MTSGLSELELGMQDGWYHLLQPGRSHPKHSGSECMSSLHAAYNNDSSSCSSSVKALVVGLASDFGAENQGDEAKTSSNLSTNIIISLLLP